MNQPLSDSRSIPDNARIAAVQMVSTPRVAENLRTAEHLIAEAVAQGAELVALPDYFPIMGMNDGDKSKVSEVAGVGPIQEFLAHTARQHGIWLVGGSMPLKASTPEKVLNACLVYSPEGEQIARYDKIHLFGFQKGGERYNESATIEAGSQPVAFDTPFGRVGLSICYDIRFPEVSRRIVDAGADLLLVPAEWVRGPLKEHHWRTLLTARALENTVYVAAADHTPPVGVGTSLVIDPMGVAVAALGEAEGVAVAALDPARVTSVRHVNPALRLRRFGTTPR